MGRLFDAAAAIVLQRDTVSYEGQAAMELEAIADAGVTNGYGFDLRPGEPAMIDPLPVIRGVVEDVLDGVAATTIAGRFHVAVAAMIVAQCEGLREARGLRQVALSGGVFQNGLLTKMTLTRLREEGFQPLTGNRVPVNDGGIAFGQAAVAAAKLEKS
jgi:hydrogenase maturation protein HypF